MVDVPALNVKLTLEAMLNPTVLHMMFEEPRERLFADVPTTDIRADVTVYPAVSTAPYATSKALPEPIVTALANVQDEPTPVKIMSADIMLTPFVFST